MRFFSTLVCFSLLTHSIKSVPSISITCTVNNSECNLSAWDKFANCIKNALPGDICETPAGNFSNIAVSISHLNGNLTNPIIIQPKNQYDTVFDGTINLNSSYYKWEEYNLNKCIYFTKLNNISIWQLFIDYQLQTPARYPPNALWKDKTIFNASLALNHGSSQSTLGLMIDSSSNIHQINSLNYSLINAIAILNIFSWKTVSSKINHHIIGSNQFNYSYPSSWLNVKYYQNTNRYYLEGLFEFMDQETEYHLDIKNNILYSYSENCVNLNDISYIRGKTQSFGLNISSSSYINISNIILFATGFNIHSSQYITLSNIIFSYSSYSRRLLGDISGPIPSYAVDILNFSVINCSFYGSDSQPIDYKGTNGYFYNNLFEYNGYSCVTPYGTRESPSPVSGSIIGGINDIFIQNSVLNYGPSIGYKSGSTSFINLNYFANQSNLQHDGAQIQVGPPYQPGTKLIQNWSYNTLKYGYRFDGCSNNGNSNCGTNCTITNCVSFNDQSIMIKGDNHTVLNNIGFNATMNNGDGNNGGNDPAICIRHLSHNWTNIHTITMNNGADSFTTNTSNGCLYPIVGYSSNNIQGPVQPQLVNPKQFDFRPKQGSIYSIQGIGPYLINDTYYWIPGRKTNEASFPIPNNNKILRFICDNDNQKYIQLMWRLGYKSALHIAKIFDNNLKLIERKEFVGQSNVWKLNPSKLIVSGKYYWSVDSVIHSNLNFSGKMWEFQLVDECL